ncbi:VWA domain-containing protein [Paraliomyxa miuraensis]|nr:VWA domain-containing protein [Paraliomyxa miuraensis]
MKMRKLDTLGLALVAWGASAAVFVACTPDEPIMMDPDGTTTMPMAMTTTGESTSNDVDPDESSGGVIKLDANNQTGDNPQCATDGSCDLVDLLFVIDNSGTMGEEQLNLARNFQQLVDELENLKDPDGQDVNPNVNIMVTTTDFGHPLCTAFQKPDYLPRQGAPVYTGCNSRINRFTGLDPSNPVVIEEACTENCPADIAPGNHFINFSSFGANVPNDDVGAALSCIGPQGIDGCGYEAPLETMLQALNEGACWNNPDQDKCDDDPEWVDVTKGFLREDSIVGIVLITDEMDCSVKAPAGYSFFTDIENTIYWNINPELEIPQATSAICFNAGVTCADDNGDGLYESCESSENSEVLHPVARYTQYLDYLTNNQKRQVVMLGILGVPEVVAHNPLPPYEPTAGGAADLLYRNWIDFPYPNGDILPDEWYDPESPTRAANKIFEFGNIGPGCTGQDEEGNFTGQAIPPVRIREVCESLNYYDEDEDKEVVRCCIESICDTNFSPAIRCLTGVLSDAIGVQG